MGKSKFDSEGFYSALDSQRKSRNLTWQDVAKQTNVSASTLTRMGQGKRPDVDSLTALINWSGLVADDFMGRSRARVEADPLAQITSILRADQSLTAESRLTLDAVVKATYESLRSSDNVKRSQ